MAAVRVPASASMTSQSISKVRSPSFAISTAARRLRPIKRWISWVRPDSFINSRPCRCGVEPGNRRYSALSHPSPSPRRQRGTLSSRQTLQRTVVRPVLTVTELKANPIGSQVTENGRRSLRQRPSARARDGSLMAQKKSHQPRSSLRFALEPPWVVSITLWNGITPLHSRSSGLSRRDLSR